jgi:hypothetical protein
LPLVRLVTRSDTPLEQIPSDLRLRWSLLAAADGWVRLLTVAQHLESHQLVNIIRGQRRLVELHPELLHPDGGYADHKGRPKESDCIGGWLIRSMLFWPKLRVFALPTPSLAGRI